MQNNDRRWAGILLTAAMVMFGAVIAPPANAMERDDGSADSTLVERSEAPGTVRRTEVRELRAPVDATPAELRQARAARETDFAALPAKVQEILSTPITQETVMEITVQPAPFQAATYQGTLNDNTCYNLKNSEIAKNGFGWELQRIELHNANVCFATDVFTTKPTASYYYNSHWGWEHCGWRWQFNDWTDPWDVHNTVGISEFGLGGCSVTQSLGGETIVNRFGNYWMT